MVGDVNKEAEGVVFPLLAEAMEDVLVSKASWQKLRT